MTNRAGAHQSRLPRQENGGETGGVEETELTWEGLVVIGDSVIFGRLQTDPTSTSAMCQTVLLPPHTAGTDPVLPAALPSRAASSQDNTSPAKGTPGATRAPKMLTWLAAHGLCDVLASSRARRSSREDNEPTEEPLRLCKGREIQRG